VLLFGGGFALASGFKESGLTIWIGSQLGGIESIHPVIIVMVICTLITFLTELTSNTATAEMLLPILGGLAIAIHMNPLFLMIPATLSCSFAFMLPVATPPNAIIFGTGKLKISDMSKVGIWINLIGIGIITAAVSLFGKYIFNIDLSHLPDWVK
jgi:sodium-dependent dicarboxylate transporter 2/3/5